MTREKIISGLQMTMDLIQFDPVTGNVRPIYTLNDIDKTTYVACKAAIEELKALEWVPVSERLPERDQICIVTDETRRNTYEYGFHDETYDEETGWTYLGHKIIAWLPLPEPYKEDTDVNDKS